MLDRKRTFGCLVALVILATAVAGVSDAFSRDGTAANAGASLSPTPGAASAAKPDSGSPPALRMERLSGGRMRLGPLLLDEGEGVLEVPARVNMNRGPIEVLACAPWGKTHESLFVVEAEPYLIQVGLLLLFGLPPQRVDSTAVIPPLAGYRPTGLPVRIHVALRDSAGSEVVVPVEQWVCMTSATGSPVQPKMEEGDWVFTGSILNQEGFAAQMQGQVVTTWTDPASIIDNPRPEGPNDDAYVICLDGVPRPGTPVTLRFSRSDRPRSPDHE
jgi:hypothetical protein